MKFIGALKERGHTASHSYISVNNSEESTDLRYCSTNECKFTIKKDAAGNNRKPWKSSRSAART